MRPPLVALVVCLAAAPLQAAAPFDVGADLDGVSLGAAIEILEDESRSLRLEDVRSPAHAGRFAPTGGTIGFAGDEPAHWLRFQLRNRTDHDVDLALDMGIATLDEVTLYDRSPSGVWVSALQGDVVPFGLRSLPIHASVFPVTVPAGATQTYYMRIQSTSARGVDVTVSGLERFIASLERQVVLLGVMYGVLLGLALYHLLLFFSVREWMYLDYGVTGLLSLLTWLTLDGFVYTLVPSGTLGPSAPMVFASLAVAGYLQFSRHLLATRSEAPKLDLAYRIQLGLLLAALVSGLFLPVGTWGRVLLPALGASFLVIFAGAVLRSRAGYGPARIYVLAWVVLSGFALTAILAPASLVINAVILTKLGVLAERVLSAFSMASRLRNLRENEARLERAAASESEARERDVELMARLASAAARHRHSEGLAEEALEALRERFQLTSGGVWLFDAEREFAVCAASFGLLDTMLRRYARVPAVMLRTWMDANPEPLVADRIGDVSGEMTQTLGERVDWSAAWLPLRKDGEALGVAYVGHAPPARLTEAERRTLSGVADELALGIHHVRAAERLAESEEYYRQLVESSPLGIMVLDRSFCIRAINAKMLAGDGRLTPDRVVGLPVEGFSAAVGWNPADREQFEVVAACMERGEEGVIEVASAGAGPARRARIHVAPIRNADGELTACQILSEDVTSERELRDQLIQAQKLEAVARLAGGLAHDFNNYLTTITGFADLLLEREEAGNAEDRDSIEMIREAADRAAGLTRRLLTFSRRQPAHERVLDVGEQLRSLEALLRRMLGEAVVLVLDLGDGPVHARLDPTQLEQVVVNLVVNARDAMPRGGEVAVRLGVAPTVEELELTVSDTGAGMPPDTLAQVFDPFFTTKEAERGTGLGLSTVHGIVTQSGGRITVESIVGRGSTFRILLPLASPEATGPATPEALATKEGRGAGRTGPIRVLVVDDERSLLLLARRVLEREGHHVSEAASAEEALKLEKEGNFQVVVSDVVLPGMTGPELCRELRRRDPALRVIFMSGYTERYEVDDILETPGALFLAKPFAPADLAGAVRSVLER